MRRRLGIAEYPLGRRGSRQPGREFLSGAARGCPVAGRLGGQCLVGQRLQRSRHALVQHQPLTRQQPPGHRLGQQGMPRPVRPIGGTVGEQPRRR